MTGAKPADGEHYWASANPVTGGQHPNEKNEVGPQVHGARSMMVNATGDVVKGFVVLSEALLLSFLVL